MLLETLERLLTDAKNDSSLKQKLIDTQKDDNPVFEFCRVATSLGYDISLGELIAVGENSSDEKLRSVNGGGTFSIDGWDDTYEQFFSELIWTK